MNVDHLRGLSPVPSVNLDNIGPPSGGSQVPAPESCKANFKKGPECFEHYKRMLRSATGTPVQCPYGFTSVAVKGLGYNLAMTGVIPFPRMGGEREREAAKRFPDNKMALVGLNSASTMIIETASRLRQMLTEVEADVLSRKEKCAKEIKELQDKAVRALGDREIETMKRYSVALHEIRKLNGKVKQTAERLCKSFDPETADSELLKIWKTAEHMSQQFDVIELIANEELADLPCQTSCEIYRMFDKFSHIYEPSDGKRRIILNGPPTKPVISICDKTFSIIPSVLIENALKYSPPDSDIRIRVLHEGELCKVSVENVSISNLKLTATIFEKGVRANDTVDGSGNGLYVAQLVAKQHGTAITFDVRPLSAGKVVCTFSVGFKTVADSTSSSRNSSKFRRLSE